MCNFFRQITKCSCRFRHFHKFFFQNNCGIFDHVAREEGVYIEFHEYRMVRARHMFSRILSFLFVNVFREKFVFSLKTVTVILAFYNLFSFLKENPFRTDQRQ